VERFSPGPYLELFARTAAPGWIAWGNEQKPTQGEMFTAQIG
jgi:hypothetical protein